MIDESESDLDEERDQADIIPLPTRKIQNLFAEARSRERICETGLETRRLSNRAVALEDLGDSTARFDRRRVSNPVSQIRSLDRASAKRFWIRAI
jgi:hypothetical protein